MQAASRDETPGAGTTTTTTSAVPRASSGTRALWSDSRAGATPSSTVTAILVGHNGSPWLTRTLDALRSSDQRPDRLIAVDTGSQDSTSDLLQASGLFDELIRLPGDTTFGAAVAAAVDRIPVDLSDPAADWIWLLHDDSAPQPAALSELLAGAERNRDAGVLGPKVRGWNDRDLLIECGLTVTNSGRPFTGLEPGDRDQGQRDHLCDVLAVGSAGMLVRTELWRRLGGFDPALPMFGDGTEFCIRARRAGAEVNVVPSSVVHHREAGLHGLRSGAPTAAQVRGGRRASELYSTLVHGPAWLLPFTSLLLLIRTMISAVVLLVADGPARARADLRVFVSVHLHPIRVLQARRLLRSVATTRRRDLADLRPGHMEQFALAAERLVVAARDLFRPHVPTAGLGFGLGLGTAAWIVAVLAIVAAVATRTIWSATGPLAGGALLPAPDGTSLWREFLTSWHDVGLGSSEPAPGYPLVLAAAALVPLVSVPDVVQLLLLFTVPLAAASGYLALRGFPHRSGRVALAVAYGLVPAAIVPSLDGRLGTAAIAIALPWLIRLLMRLVGGLQLQPVLGRPRVRTAAAAALLLAGCTAFAPIIWVAAAVGLVFSAAVRVRNWAIWFGVALVLVLPLVLLFPWSWGVLTDPSRAMFEAGVSSPQLVAQNPPGWRLLLLDPGTLPGPTTWVASGLVAFALLGLVRTASRSLALWGWTLVLIGLVGATVQTTGMFVPIGATTAQHGFAGPMVLVMAGGMVLAAGAALQAGGPNGAAAQRITASIMVCALLAGPIVLAVSWMTGWTGPLGRTDDTVVPAFATEAALSADRIRILLVEQGADSAVAYSLVNGDGGRLGDADVAPPAETWSEISAAVGALAAGTGPAPAMVLAENAVRYIVADTSDDSLAESLDKNSALSRLSTSDGRGVWQIEGSISRARVESPDAATKVAMPDLTSGVLVDGQVPSAAEAQLVIAQVDDGAWRSTVAGDRVPVEGGNQLLVPLPASGPVEVLVEHETAPRRFALLVPALALVIVIGMLLPRRHIGSTFPDLDPDPTPEAEAAALLLDLTDGSHSEVLP